MGYQPNYGGRLEAKDVVATALAVTIILVGVVALIWWALRHPCLCTREYRCTYQECTFETSIPCGENCEVPTCLAWETRERTCHECAIRMPDQRPTEFECPPGTTRE